MKTKEILMIHCLALLGIALISSLFKKVPGIVKNGSFFIAIVLLAVSQVLDETENLELDSIIQENKCKTKTKKCSGTPAVVSNLCCPDPHYTGILPPDDVAQYFTDPNSLGKVCNLQTDLIENPNTLAGYCGTKNSTLFSPDCATQCCTEQCSYCQDACGGGDNNPKCIKNCLEARNCIVASGSGTFSDGFVINTDDGTSLTIKCPN